MTSRPTAQVMQVKPFTSHATETVSFTAGVAAVTPWRFRPTTSPAGLAAFLAPQGRRYRRGESPSTDAGTYTGHLSSATQWSSLRNRNPGVWPPIRGTIMSSERPASVTEVQRLGGEYRDEG